MERTFQKLAFCGPLLQLLCESLESGTRALSIAKAALAASAEEVKDVMWMEVYIDTQMWTGRSGYDRCEWQVLAARFGLGGDASE